MHDHNTFPTAAELHDILRYYPETGQLWWKSKPGSCAPLKEEAGYLMPNGYRRISCLGKKLYAHRIIWCMVYGEPSTAAQIDHINGDPSDNRLTNLREATPTQNAANTSAWRSNRAGLKGVRQVGDNRWRARIRVAGKEINLGTHPTKEAAQEAYWKASEEAYGEFARTSGHSSTEAA